MSPTNARALNTMRQRLKKHNGGEELAPLLDGLPAGLTAFELARAWQARLPPRAGLATAAWMVERGLLLREDEARGART